MLAFVRIPPVEEEREEVAINGADSSGPAGWRRRRRRYVRITALMRPAAPIPAPIATYKVILPDFPGLLEPLVVLAAGLEAGEFEAEELDSEILAPVTVAATTSVDTDGSLIWVSSPGSAAVYLSA